jgi:hypothetical protein
MPLLTFRVSSGEQTRLECEPSMEVFSLRRVVRDRLPFPYGPFEFQLNGSSLPNSRIGDWALSDGAVISVETVPELGGAVERTRTRPASQLLPPGFTVPSPETFDANVGALMDVLDGRYDPGLVIAALVQANNSVQLAADILLSNTAHPLPPDPVRPTRGRVQIDPRIPEPAEAVRLRTLIEGPGGLLALVGQLRDVSAGLADAVLANPLPLLVSVGLAFFADGNVLRSLPIVKSPFPPEAIAEMSRLIMLGYRSLDVLRAWNDCSGDLAAVEARLRV